MASSLATRWTPVDRVIQWHRFRMVVPHIPRGSVLADLGCGTGVFLRHIDGRISRGYGVDAKIAESEPDSKTEFKRGDLEATIPLPDQSADVVTALAVLEHLERPEEFIGEVFRILKRGGTCLMTTPSPRAKPLLEFLAFRLKVISERDIADHKTYFDESMLRKAFRNFQDIRISHFQLGLNTFVVARK